MHSLVRTALQAQTVDSVVELRRLAGGRVDALLRSVWDRAIGGNLYAVRAATGVALALVTL